MHALLNPACVEGMLLEEMVSITVALLRGVLPGFCLRSSRFHTSALVEKDVRREVLAFWTHTAPGRDDCSSVHTFVVAAVAAAACRRNARRPAWTIAIIVSRQGQRKSLAVVPSGLGSFSPQHRALHFDLDLRASTPTDTVQITSTPACDPERQQGVQFNQAVEIRKTDVPRQIDQIFRMSSEVTHQLDHFACKDPQGQQFPCLRTRERGPIERVKQRGVVEQGEIDETGQVHGVHTPRLRPPNMPAPQTRRVRAPARARPTEAL